MKCVLCVCVRRAQCVMCCSSVLQLKVAFKHKRLLIILVMSAGILKLQGAHLKTCRRACDGLWKQ